MEFGIIKWAVEFVGGLFGRRSERHRRFIGERVGPLEDYFDVAYAGLDLTRDRYVGEDDAGVSAEQLARTRELFLEMAARLAPLRHGATAAANAIGDAELTECWRDTEKMLTVLSTFLQLAREVRGTRGTVRSVIDDTIAPISKGTARIRGLLI